MGKPTKENLYSYKPSLAVAIVFTALSAIWLLWHFYLSVWLPRSRIHKHRYTIPLLISTILSTAGWGMRAVNTFHLGSVNLYGNSSSYIVIAPIFVCASLYLQLKYLVNLCLPHGPAQTLFGISPRWLGRIFIASDVFSFLMQGGGSGISASGNWEGNLKEIGVNVLLAGLGLQLATFTFYLVFLWTFVCRVHRTEGVAFDNSTKKVLVGMWIASVFVQIRTIFRLAEFALGVEGYLFSHEWCIYTFEAMPMWVALGVLAWAHPVKWLQKSRTDYMTIEPKDQTQMA